MSVIAEELNVNDLLVACLIAMKWLAEHCCVLALDGQQMAGGLGNGKERCDIAMSGAPRLMIESSKRIVSKPSANSRLPGTMYEMGQNRLA